MLASTALLGVGLPPTRGTTYTWTGAGGNAWSNNGSWQGNTAPPPDGLTASDLLFGSTIAIYPSINGSYRIRSLTFTGTNTYIGLNTVLVGTLVLSTGGNSGGGPLQRLLRTGAAVVPEPGTWGLLGIGIGTLGLTLRQRHGLAPRT